MPLQLLPKSAQAFAPRAPPTIVLNTKVEPWLTQTLKRINKVKRPLNNPSQHFKNLTETLGGENAIWSLASLLLPKAPESDLRKDDNPLMEAINNYEMLHVEAYVVHVDMVSQYEVAFKLTKKTIEDLITYHKDIYSVDAAATTFDWPEKDSQVKSMKEDFVQAANRFVFRTSARALEGLEEEGAGELLDGRSDDVRKAVMNLFTPLSPPPPRIIDVIHPAPTLPSTSGMAGWWQAPGMLAPYPPVMDPFRVLPSTPSPTTTACSDPHSLPWPSTTWSLDVPQLPSPTPSYSQPSYTTATPMYSSPQPIAVMPVYHYPSQLPLQSCGSSMTGGSLDSYGFSGYSTFAAPQYAATT